jgi:SAM-dependent methyltransferase
MSDHVARNRRYWDTELAAVHGPLARQHWSGPPRWGLWSAPEERVAALPAEVAGMRAVELGCGTGYVSAWLARAGAHPVGVDVSAEQLATARAMQAEFGLRFPLLLADAERVPLRDGAFDLAISEYGASLWCDPYRWIPEAARLLRPGGRLVFALRSPLFGACRVDGGPVDARLRRPMFGLRGLELGGGVEQHLPHGEMVRLLRSAGFTIEDLVELPAPADARDYWEVPSEWARSWPSEELWKVRLTGPPEPW